MSSGGGLKPGWRRRLSQMADDATRMMRAMTLNAPGEALELQERALPVPGPGELLVKVHACGVCRTDLHVVDGELPDPKLPVVPGHEIVGAVQQTGPDVEGFRTGQRVGVPWLGWTCGRCRWCLSGRENLCDLARFTGYTLDGGYADYVVSDARYTFALPEGLGDAETAPLLCAGFIGYRSLRMAGEGERLGLYGFGASAHIVCQIARWQGRKVFAFTRPGDTEGQEFARSMGAQWAGGSDEPPPEKLDAAIIFAPVGALAPAALKAVDKAGVVVCAGIHMSDIPAFAYRLLWEERILRSVANLTRRDGEELLEVAPKVPLHTHVETFPLPAANEALSRLRSGQITGAVVLTMA